MGQKVNPIGFRLGVNRDWRSRWYASPQEMPEFLHSDIQIRDYVKKKLQYAAVSKIVIERAWNSIRVTIFTARPGIVIGRKGAEIEKMTEEISKMAKFHAEVIMPQRHDRSTNSVLGMNEKWADNAPFENFEPLPVPSPTNLCPSTTLQLRPAATFYANSASLQPRLLSTVPSLNNSDFPPWCPRASVSSMSHIA